MAATPLPLPPLTLMAYVPHALILSSDSGAAGHARTPDGCQVGLCLRPEEHLSKAVRTEVAAGHISLPVFFVELEQVTTVGRNTKTASTVAL